MADKAALNVSEAAAFLGVHVNTLKRIDPRELPFFRIGARGDRRYDALDLRKYKGQRMVREP